MAQPNMQNPYARLRMQSMVLAQQLSYNNKLIAQIELINQKSGAQSTPGKTENKTLKLMAALLR